MELGFASYQRVKSPEERAKRELGQAILRLRIAGIVLAAVAGNLLLRDRFHPLGFNLSLGLAGLYTWFATWLPPAI